jgi:hypothetical protein
VISERIIYSIQGRRLPNFYRRRRDQHGPNYRFWLDHSAHDVNLALKTVLSQLVTNGIISMLCFFKPFLSSIDLKFHLSANLSLKEEFDSWFWTKRQDHVIYCSLTMEWIKIMVSVSVTYYSYLKISSWFWGKTIIKFASPENFTIATTKNLRIERI